MCPTIATREVTISAKRRFTRSQTSHRARPRGAPASGVSPLGRRFRTAISALALGATIGLVGASPGLASTGTVFLDASRNVGAGETLFNGTLTGQDNVGLGRTVMPSLTTGFNNVAIGTQALDANTTGFADIATGTLALG
jgi:hypothetical protein